jgi:hypothetical protein
MYIKGGETLDAISSWGRRFPGIQWLLCRGVGCAGGPPVTARELTVRVNSAICNMLSVLLLIKNIYFMVTFCMAVFLLKLILPVILGLHLPLHGYDACVCVES